MPSITGRGRTSRNAAGSIPSYSRLLGSPAVASTTAVHAAVTDTGATQTITTGFTQPDVPRNLTITFGGTTANITAVQVSVTGTDISGSAQTETFPAATAGAGSTVVGSKAFASVTSASIPANGTGVTTAIGTGSKLGLPGFFTRDSIVGVYVNGVRETTRPTVAFSATVLGSNTITPATSLSGVPVVCDYVL